MVTATHEGGRRIVVAVDAAAWASRLRPGMTVTHAQTLVPDLHIAEAQPDEDAAALERLALWCTRYSPLVTAQAPDNLFIDIAGAAHLFKGETALREDLQHRLEAVSYAARIAIADTPGCAWAIARYGADMVVPPGRMADVLGSLPVAALRLPAETVQSLRDVGLERIAQVASKPRGPLQTRFGRLLLDRLDQALGTVPESLPTLIPPEVPRVKMKFVEPVGDPEDLQRIIVKLCETLMRDLEARGVGARRLDLVFLRVDAIAQAIRIGTSRPNRDVKHLAKLLIERLVLVDPGFGIEEASLTASWIEALTERQTLGGHVAEQGADVDVSGLVDTLGVRLGAERVFRLVPVESDIPERALKRAAVAAKPDGAQWPDDLPRPARLVSPPEPVMAVAQLPDAPPMFFVWRKKRYRIRKADGPERILGEWWKSDADVGMRRDYYRVEAVSGERFWLFRDAPPEEGGRWFLHGLGDA